jgi:hypothetical protein
MRHFAKSTQIKDKQPKQFTIAANSDSIDVFAWKATIHFPPNFYKVQKRGERSSKDGWRKQAREPTTDHIIRVAQQQQGE